MTEPQQLAEPLLSSQIEAASRYWKVKGGWESKEIVQLVQVFPNPQEAVRLKAIAVNALYGTNIIAISKVADCVDRVLRTTHSSGPDLVEEMVVAIGQITKQKNYSFASKYGHFFIDSDLPILDWYAEWLVGKHLGEMKSKNPKRYLRFSEDIATLKRVAGLTCNCAELDGYLWVAGEYWYWKDHPKMNVSGELKGDFMALEQDAEKRPFLAGLLGIGVSPVQPIDVGSDLEFRPNRDPIAIR